MKLGFCKNYKALLSAVFLSCGTSYSGECISNVVAALNPANMLKSDFDLKKAAAVATIKRLIKESKNMIHTAIKTAENRIDEDMEESKTNFETKLDSSSKVALRRIKSSDDIKEIDAIVDEFHRKLTGIVRSEDLISFTIDNQRLNDMATIELPESKLASSTDYHEV